MRTYRPGGGRVAFGGMGITPGVKLLLIANAVVYVLQSVFGDLRPGPIGPITGWFSFIPQSAIFGLEIWRFFTYMFLHAGLFHIGMNMFILWMFGCPIEARWGQRTFLIYYVVCGLGGALAYGLFNLVGISSFSPMIGASGAVYGILLAYGLTFPESVLLVMMIFPMKAKYAVLLWGAIALMSSAADSGSGVAHLAHLGGMVTGFIFLKMTIPSLSAGTATGLGRTWKQWQTKRKMKIVRPKQKPGNGDAGSPPSGKQSEIDAILDKISREGLESLTPEEQDILRRAGRK